MIYGRVAWPSDSKKMFESIREGENGPAGRQVGEGTIEWEKKDEKGLRDVHVGVSLMFLCLCMGDQRVECESRLLKFLLVWQRASALSSLIKYILGTKGEESAKKR